jgi:hypothetical protein
VLLGVLGDIVTPPHAIVCSLAAKHVHLQLEDYYFFRQGSVNLVTVSSSASYNLNVHPF